MNRQGFFKALGVLAKTPAMQKYLNVLKPSAVREGIEQATTSGMDFFNLVIKRVVGEGKEIDSTLTTKKYVHPDRPDIFVEVDLSTGNANVGLVDPDRGAFAYTDMMKRDQLIKSLEDEGLGSMGAIARADEIERMRKAEAMKKIGIESLNICHFVILTVNLIAAISMNKLFLLFSSNSLTRFKYVNWCLYAFFILLAS